MAFILIVSVAAARASRSSGQQGCELGPTPPPISPVSPKTWQLPAIAVPEAPQNKHPYCCPKTKKCLLAYFTRCGNDTEICAQRGQICCPLTKQCADPVPNETCIPPPACKDTEYCSPHLGKCLMPSTQKCDKGHSNHSSCAGEFPVCDGLTERCVKIGADCVSPCWSQPPTLPPAPPAPPSPATKTAAADMCAQWGVAMRWNCSDLESICSSWNHVVCSGGNITALYLTHKKLTGAIPPSIGLLSSLQKLDLRCNNVTGSVPDTIGNLQNLQNLELRFNRLTGHVPDSVCRLTKLTQLTMSDNRELTGPIPECIGQLTKLQELSFSECSLTGPLPESVSQLTSLAELELNGNNLSGIIPGAAIRALTQLPVPHLGWIYLAGNNWTCPLPNITSPPWRDLQHTTCEKPVSRQP